MRKKKFRYASGGGVDEDKLKEATSGLGAIAPRIEAPKQSFSEAFAAARKAGDETFTWNGKSFNTQLRGEAAAGRSRSPAPARPAARSAPKPAAQPTVSAPAPKPAAPAPRPAPPVSRPEIGDPNYLAKIGMKDRRGSRPAPKPAPKRDPEFARRAAAMQADKGRWAAPAPAPKKPDATRARFAAAAASREAEKGKWVKPEPKKKPDATRARFASAAASRAAEKGKWVKKAKGGLVRGDGCAKQGHTKGKMR